MSKSLVSLWGIILAGGEGTRLQGFFREQLGEAIPKQFCAFVGQHSLLQRTVRQARLPIPSERLVVIGTAHHNSYIYQHLGAPRPGTVLLQPINRDTMPGIVLSLIHIPRKDPQAVVAILPSDQVPQCNGSKSRNSGALLLVGQSCRISRCDPRDHDRKATDGIRNPYGPDIVPLKQRR